MGLSDCRVEAAAAVSDLQRARRFYEEGLGLSPGEQEEGVSVRYPCDGGSALFIFLSPDNAGRSPATWPAVSSTISGRRWTSSAHAA